jgi:lipopolysaccharide biosynthesis glycosyltransferase
VYIASSTLEQVDIDRLSSIGKIFGVELIFKQIQAECVSGFRQHLHLSRAAYYRILLADIIKEESKVIYLDCDLVVEADLQELWDTDVSNCGCAGVDEGNPAQTSRLGLDPDFYINSGVLVLNLDYWRSHNIITKNMEWLEANPHNNILLDQDAINSVLKFQKTRIGLKWNLNPVPLEDIGVLKEYPEHILHFGGPIKPWHKCYDFDLQAIYRKYLNYTPWADSFSLGEPRNIGQACLVANQLYQAGDFMGACRYYQIAIDFRVKSQPIETKLLLDAINGGHRHFNNQDYFSACEHYRSCVEHWGYPIAYEINIYKMPGILDGVF